MRCGIRFLRLLDRLWRACAVKKPSCRPRESRGRDSPVSQTVTDLREEHGEVRANIARLRANEDLALRPFLASISVHANGLDAAVYRGNALLENARKLWEQEEEAYDRKGAHEITVSLREKLGERDVSNQAPLSSHQQGTQLPAVREE